jgi:hypothetical protein
VLSKQVDEGQVKASKNAEHKPSKACREKRVTGRESNDYRETQKSELLAAYCARICHAVAPIRQSRKNGRPA